MQESPLGLLGLLADERIPNADALALAPTVGWLMLLGFSLFIAVCIFHREAWRRIFLRAEDPRAVALFRIVFAIATLGNINGLSDLFLYLFTDEGLFLTDAAREVFAKEQFAGFGDGIGSDPYGFFGFDGVLEFLKGPKFSTLFFWDSPLSFWLHLAAFEVAAVCLLVGYKTNVSKWATLLLFHFITLRNQVFWEGTENVYRCFLLYLCMSRCGHAYSVDNWLRCRKLREQGLLSEPGKPGAGAGAGAPPSPEHPHGLQAIYRLIPAWPRMVMILQLAALYCATGTVKNGDIWGRGDAFYYALNLDHFYRFEPQQLSAVFGTTLFRLSTFVTHWWEAFFPLVVLGLVVRFVRREKLPPLPSWQRWVVRACWLGIGLVALTVVQITLPVHIPAGAGFRPGAWSLATWQTWFPILWLSGMAIVGGLFWWLGNRPPTVHVRGRAYTLDLDWFCSWFLGRRIWLGLGLVFHAHLLVLMNIGWFTPATMSVYIVFLNGSEIAYLLHALGQRLARLRLPVPKNILAPPPPAEDRTLPQHHRDAAEMPPWALWAALAAADLGVYLNADPRIGVPWAATGAVIFTGLALVGFTQAQKRGHVQLSLIDPWSGQPRRPWAYGTLGRFLVSGFVAYHCTGVAIWLLPEKDSLGGEGQGSWRLRAQDPFKAWLRFSQTSQGWKMFAPNPPRSNNMMQVIVTDQAGETYDLNTDVYHPDQKPIPWLFYTRQRKINRRIVGSEGGKGEWYQKWHTRWVCRQWALEHGGEAPKKVELFKLSYPIPSPEEVRKNGPYVPEERMRTNRFRKLVYTGECSDIHAQLPNYIRERHGLPPLPDDAFRPWVKNRKVAWEKRRKQGRTPMKWFWYIVAVVALVGAAGLRWRGVDRDNKRRAEPPAA